MTQELLMKALSENDIVCLRGNATSHKGKPMVNFKLSSKYRYSGTPYTLFTNDERFPLLNNWRFLKETMCRSCLPIYYLDTVFKSFDNIVIV